MRKVYKEKDTFTRTKYGKEAAVEFGSEEAKRAYERRHGITIREEFDTEIFNRGKKGKGGRYKKPGPESNFYFHKKEKLKADKKWNKKKLKALGFTVF